VQPVTIEAPGSARAMPAELSVGCTDDGRVWFVAQTMRASILTDMPEKTARALLHALRDACDAAAARTTRPAPTMEAA
jgi:hypothetical protein